MEFNKTYIVGGLVVLFSVLFAIGAIGQKLFLALLGILLGTGEITTRQAIAKLEGKNPGNPGDKEEEEEEEEEEKEDESGESEE